MTVKERILGINKDYRNILICCDSLYLVQRYRGDGGRLGRRNCSNKELNEDIIKDIENNNKLNGLLNRKIILEGEKTSPLFLLNDLLLAVEEE